MKKPSTVEVGQKWQINVSDYKYDAIVTNIEKGTYGQIANIRITRIVYDHTRERNIGTIRAPAVTDMLNEDKWSYLGKEIACEHCK